MNRLSQLDAVNIVLRNLGENPLASLEVQYPTLDIVLPALDEALVEILAEGWWFNTRYRITLSPDINGEVPVPAGTLAFYPEDNSITFEGTRLIDKDTGSPVLNKQVNGKLVSYIEFVDVPTFAQYAITYKAAYQVYTSDSGEDSTSQSILQRALGYYQQLSAQHTRSQNFNSKRKPIVQRWYANLRS